MGYTQVRPTVNEEPLELRSYEQYRYEAPLGQPPQQQAHRDEKSPVKNWPVQSQPVSRLTPRRIIFIFFDAILASAPLMFIALAFVAARLDGKPVSDYGTNLEHVLLLSPTIFPIVFAALMGRCFKHIGLWRAERAITLGRLEQFVGSISLFSALERLLALRSFSVLGIILTLVWLLSPLGGQSALRILDTKPKSITSQGNYNFMNPGAFEDTFLLGPSAVNGARAAFTSIYLAALLSSTKYASTPMDLWGNVKMPSFKALSSATDPDGWKNVDYTQNVTYSSLIGVPVANINADGNSSYTLKSRYFDMSCSNITLEPTETFGNQTYTMALNYSLTPKCDAWPCDFTMQSLDENDNVTTAQCDLTYIYVEANVSCDRLVCQADRIRQLNDDGLSSGLRAIVRGVFTDNAMIFFPTIDQYNVGSAVARGSSNSEKWIFDPSDFIGQTYANVDLWKLKPDVLAERFGILYNTFWQSMFGTTALGGNLPKNLTSLQTDVNEHLTFNQTDAVIIRKTKDVYHTEWKWFAALLVSSILLQIAAYTGLVLKYITLAPDIIGYASSLTLMNPYIPVPTGGTTLDGLERAALLKDLKIRIGDVCGHEPVGAVAVAKADEGRVTRLDRKKLYI